MSAGIGLSDGRFVSVRFFGFGSFSIPDFCFALAFRVPTIGVPTPFWQVAADGLSRGGCQIGRPDSSERFLASAQRTLQELTAIYK